MVIAVAALSCTEREENSPDEQRSKVAYMAISTRAQGATESLNQDATDNEDKVVTLRLMAFEKATGRAIYNKVHPIADFTNYEKKVPMRTGEYDFCFVANETPEMTTALDKITFKDGLYYDDALTKIAYKGVNDKPTTFLMTAELTGTVNATHTLATPLKLDVKLVRCLAKVNVNMDYKTPLQKEATKGLRLTFIKFGNLPRTYSLFPPKTPYTDRPEELMDDSYTTLAEARYSDEGINPVLRKTFYVPEHLRAAGAPDATQSTIEVGYEKHGISRSQTVAITHQSWNQANDKYTPANFAALSEKSIVRNTSYSLSGTLEGWVEESISFKWEVLPWTVVSSFKQFSAVIVTTTIDETQPNLDVQGDNGNELLWHAGAVDGLKMTFNIEAPAGGVWRFTITNRIDFELTGEMKNTGTPAISGVAGSGPVVLTIKPLKPWTGTIRSTELYLTINGVEVQIVPKFQTAGKDPGPTRRYLIKQVN